MKRKEVTATGLNEGRGRGQVCVAEMQYDTNIDQDSLLHQTSPATLLSPFPIQHH